MITTAANASPESTDAVEDPRLKLVNRALQRFQYQPDALIEVLHAAQEAYGFLSEETLGYVAEKLRLPESQVVGVATFYHFFSMRPRGEHSCIVCTGTACYVKGAGEIVAAVEEEFGIRAGETTPDGRFTLGTARCLGNCSLAPMLTLDDEVLGKETPEGVIARIRQLLGSAESSEEAAE